MDFGLFITTRDAERVRELNQAQLRNLRWERKGSGSAEFTMSSEDPDAPVLTKWVHELLVTVDGDPKWWGPLWNRSGSPGRVDWECKGLLSLMEKRFVTTTSMLFTGVEQTSIAWEIMEYGQTPQGSEDPFKDLNIQQHTEYPTSGKTRSREYKRGEHPNLYELLWEFPDLDDGYDIGIEFDGTLQRWFQAYYPAMGTYHEAFRLEYGRNILDYNLDESVDEQENDTYATGGSANNVQFEGHYTNDAGAEAIGLMTGVYSEGSMLDPNWLLDKAKKRAMAMTPGLTKMDLTAITIPVDYFTTVHVGDRLAVVIDDGANQFRGFVIVDALELDPDKSDLDLEVVVISDPQTDPILRDMIFSDTGELLVP